jgi:hypothetical protein
MAELGYEKASRHKRRGHHRQHSSETIWFHIALRDTTNFQRPCNDWIYRLSKCREDGRLGVTFYQTLEFFSVKHQKRRMSDLACWENVVRDFALQLLPGIVLGTLRLGFLPFYKTKTKKIVKFREEGGPYLFLTFIIAHTRKPCLGV